MAEPLPGTTPSPPAGGASAAPKPPAKPQNPAFRAMGLPQLPKRLPSRNWLIFLSVTGTFAGWIIYDKREKKRAIAKWQRLVAPLSEEKLSSPNQLPRKLTIYLESPPGNTLRVAQDHFVEYAKPVLAKSGLDWEFVQGRQQGDVRAAVAEKIRRHRRQTERPGEDIPETSDSSLAELRKKMNLPEYEGMKGDIVLGHHTWKEYVRGLHEGWLGSLDAPVLPPIEAPPKPEVEQTDGEKNTEEKKEEKKPERPPQPIPHNKPEDYASASLPPSIPSEFSPSAPLPFPHRLGFSQTFVRLAWFLNRRKLADSIGRDVAAVCYGTARDWRSTEEDQYEQQLVHKEEEKNWPKSVWKGVDEEEKKEREEANLPPKELVWTNPLTMDSRIASRMRRFEISPELEVKAANIKVPEEEVEGWIKGKLRGLWRWSTTPRKTTGPNVGNLDDE